MTGEEQRALLDGLLDGHVPVDAREGMSLARVRVALGHLDAPFDERADAMHVTGSAIVVGTRGVLLLVHRRLGRWLQPGGHLEPGEVPWEGAARETREETGIAAHHPTSGPRLVHVDVHDAADGHTHLDLRFLLLAPDDDEPQPPPEESQQVQWFAWPDAYAVADESLRGALTTARGLVANG